MKICGICGAKRNHKSEIRNQKTMSNENKNTVWGKILQIAITVLTAIATALGLQACGIL